jgi:short subunit dehydrogenase-like uncharacterized protein
MSATPPERPFDIVLLGATGFTGKLVAEYIAARAKQEGVTWAIAGRSRDKLEAVRRDLALSDLPLRIADTSDAALVDALVRDARVVCTTVGPYARYGRELVRACARHGTSYCDLTGEPNFIRAAIDECHDTARASGARIVTCAGFDSIPSDLAAHMAWSFAREKHSEDLSWCKVFVRRLRGAMSGGSIATVFDVVDTARTDRDARRTMLDPHGLDPTPGRAPRDPFEDDQRTVRFDDDIRGWTAPFLMAPINTRIVRRSNALLREEGRGYGARFRYHEAMSFAPSARGLVGAAVVTGGLGGILAATALPGVRSLVARHIVPAPGEGPSRAAMERGYYELRVVAQTESGRRLDGTVAGKGDPGYIETAKMLSESAFCLAKDGARLPSRFGVLTPATAMGMRLVERLRAAGITFEIGDA